MGECYWYEKSLGKVVELTPHALNRKKERAITDSDIVLTLKHGMQPPGTNQRCYRDLVVAFERSGNCIVVLTVFRKGEELVA